MVMTKNGSRISSNFATIVRLKKVARRGRAEAAQRRLDNTELVLDAKKIPGLKRDRLTDQVKLFKAAGAPNLANTALSTLKVDDKRAAILVAIGLYSDGKWGVGSSESDSESEMEGVSAGNSGDLSKGSSDNEDFDVTCTICIIMWSKWSRREVLP